jgi:cell division protein FtsB
MSEHTGQTTKKMRRRAEKAHNRRWLWLNETKVALGWFIVLGLGALLGTIYLSQASRIAGTGRRMQSLQEDLNNIKRENAEIERQIAGAQSLSRLQEGAEQMGFITADPEDIEYLVVADYPPPVAPQPTAEPPPQPVETMDEALWLVITSRLSDLVQGNANEN